MMDRQKGKFVIECETCDEVLETNTGDFNEARELMKAERWESVHDDDENTWVHFCPKCR
jgi:hypothetical protein